LLAELKKLGDARTRDELGPRYGITAPTAFGVSMAKVQALARRIGQNDALARALWDTGYYDARLLAALVADPAALTSPRMDDWCADFDNWAVVDTVCFKLFDRAATPLAFAKVDQWSTRDGRDEEFVKRAGLALLACLALHDAKSPDDAFASRLPLVERGAGDERNFVKKAASWALKAIGRRSRPLMTAATAVARRLSLAPPGSPARWVGKDALKGLGDLTFISPRAVAPRRQMRQPAPPQ
jgi:3-methyladenine DNA glycosylase AlkD